MRLWRSPVAFAHSRMASFGPSRHAVAGDGDAARVWGRTCDAVGPRTSSSGVSSCLTSQDPALQAGPELPQSPQQSWPPLAGSLPPHRPDQHVRPAPVCSVWNVTSCSVKEASHRRTNPVGPHSRWSPRETDPQRQEVGGGARAGGGSGCESLMGTEFPFGKMRKS